MQPGVLYAPLFFTSLEEWACGIREEWFGSNTACLANVFWARISEIPSRLEDSPLLRCVTLFCAFDVIELAGHCPQCKKALVLGKHAQVGSTTLRWVCPVSKKHHVECLKGRGALKSVRMSQWPAFLFMVVLLKIGRSWAEIQKELRDGFQLNLKHSTAHTWRLLYQTQLQKANAEQGLLQIGDETWLW